MAETPAPEVKTPEDDPFDLGDTGLNFTAPQEPAKKPTPPKGPDGKFISPNDIEPPAPKHPAALVSQARDFGLEDETIAEMSTPTLYRTVNLFLIREREIARSFATQRDLQGAAVAQPQPVPQPPPAVEADPLDALITDGFDPRLINALKEAKKAPADKIKALEAELANERQTREQSDIAEKVALLDAAFAKMADPRFGEGAAAELAKDPSKQSELKRRRALLIDIGITDVRLVNRHTIMKLLRQGRDQLFGDLPSATSGATAKEPENPYTAKPTITPEEWNNGGVARPSRRNGSPELKGDALAIKNLTEKFREMDAQRTDEAELEGIPD